MSLYSLAGGWFADIEKARETTFNCASAHTGPPAFTDEPPAKQERLPFEPEQPTTLELLVQCLDIIHPVKSRKTTRRLMKRSLILTFQVAPCVSHRQDHDAYNVVSYQDPAKHSAMQTHGNACPLDVPTHLNLSVA